MNLEASTKYAFNRAIAFLFNGKEHKEATRLLIQSSYRSGEIVNAMKAFEVPAFGQTFFYENVWAQAERQRVDMWDNSVAEYLDVMEAAVVATRNEMKMEDGLPPSDGQYLDRIDNAVQMFRRWHERLSKDERVCIDALPKKYGYDNPTNLRRVCEIVGDDITEKTLKDALRRYPVLKKTLIG